MSTENITGASELNLLREAHPEWSIQPPTMRIKRVFFNGPTSPSVVIEEAAEIWATARSLFRAPLVQLRAILPLENEEKFLEELSERRNRVFENTKAELIGRIPFSVSRRGYAIYYLQIESADRRSYTNGSGLTHEDAVRIGFEKRDRHEVRLANGFTFRAIDFSEGRPFDVLTGEFLNLDLRELSQEIVSVHKSAFNYPHDPTQQTKEGVTGIMLNNPTVLAFDPDGRVSSVGFLERDDRFSFGQAVLVEPTYFTRPDAEGKGLSSHLRQLVRTIIQEGHKIPSYNGRLILLFNESIRGSSFPLCLENGFQLAGEIGPGANGDLGDAYTAIGPASPEAGYMPMGLTYLTSPELEIS